MGIVSDSGRQSAQVVPPGSAFPAEIHARLKGLDLSCAREVLALLRVLYQAGREDLAFARLLEGHVDAIQILRRTTNGDQRRQINQLIAGGGVLGVWNADLSEAPLSWQDRRLYGGKAFASGAGLLSHALVTVHAGDKDRVQLLLIDLEKYPPHIDRQWWNVLGMQATETHLVRWNGLSIREDCRIGKAGDCEREPWFSAGALRFVAVQAGGIAAIFDGVRDHLVQSGRADDPYQATRLASLYSCASLSASVVREAADCWHAAKTDVLLAAIRHARIAVTEQAEKAILLAQQCVGVQSLFLAHPLSAPISNLMVYIRQPAPDAQKREVGRAAAAEILRPDL